jgi:hypothetical protein
MIKIVAYYYIAILHMEGLQISLQSSPSYSIFDIINNMNGVAFDKLSEKYAFFLRWKALYKKYIDKFQQRMITNTEMVDLTDLQTIGETGHVEQPVSTMKRNVAPARYESVIYKFNLPNHPTMPEIILKTFLLSPPTSICSIRELEPNAFNELNNSDTTTVALCLNEMFFQNYAYETCNNLNIDVKIPKVLDIWRQRQQQKLSPSKKRSISGDSDPNISGCHLIFEMEFVEMQPISNILNETNYEEIYDKICKIIDFFESKYIFHNDLHCENVQICFNNVDGVKQYQICIIDFGKATNYLIRPLSPSDFLSHFEQLRRTNTKPTFEQMRKWSTMPPIIGGKRKQKRNCKSKTKPKSKYNIKNKTSTRKRTHRKKISRRKYGK